MRKDALYLVMVLFGLAYGFLFVNASAHAGDRSTYKNYNMENSPSIRDLLKKSRFSVKTRNHSPERFIGQREFWTNRGAEMKFNVSDKLAIGAESDWWQNKLGESERATVKGKITLRF